MGKIAGIHIHNYGPLKDVQMGSFLMNGTDFGSPFGNVTGIIGPSGSGKSSLADVFGFLSDCIFSDVESACDMNQRGGFGRLISQRNDGTIEFIISYQEKETSVPLLYFLTIALDANDRPFVKREFLIDPATRNERQSPFINREQTGEGQVFQVKLKKSKEHIFQQVGDSEPFKLSDTRKLAVAALGEMEQYPLIGQFLSFMKSWYLCYFSPDDSRRVQMTAPAQYLNRRGDNINNVARHMLRENPAAFRELLTDIQAKIPDITRIEPLEMPNGQVELGFYQKGFEKPFFSSRMSDGTLKLFAYYLMLHEKNPRQLVFIEEPENGLYHHYLSDLALEMKRSAGNGFQKQIFVTTHSPFFINALSPEDVWVLEKGDDGFTVAKRASEYEFVKELTEEGAPLGDLWYSKYFG